MKQFLEERWALILLMGILGLAGSGCSSFETTNLPSKNTQVVIKESPPPVKLPPLPVPLDRFEQALDKAYGAATITQSAQSTEDWRAIAIQWREAISLMKAVPASSPHKVIARKKIIQYQQSLKYAQQQAIRPISLPLAPEVVTIPTAPQAPSKLVTSSSSGVFQVAIKSRHGGTPVVDVTFNSGRQFEMIVDTGASGTVITQQMAVDLGVVPTGKATANTASDRNVEFSLGNVNSIEVGGAVVNNVLVAIAPTANLDVGLLGQDFFSNYDVTIKRDVVEFRSR